MEWILNFTQETNDVKYLEIIVDSVELLNISITRNPDIGNIDEPFLLGKTDDYLTINFIPLKRKDKKNEEVYSLEEKEKDLNSDRRKLYLTEDYLFKDDSPDKLMSFFNALRRIFNSIISDNFIRKHFNNERKTANLSNREFREIKVPRVISDLISTLNNKNYIEFQNSSFKYLITTDTFEISLLPVNPGVNTTVVKKDDYFINEKDDWEFKRVRKRKAPLLIKRMKDSLNQLENELAQMSIDSSDTIRVLNKPREDSYFYDSDGNYHEKLMNPPSEPDLSSTEYDRIEKKNKKRLKRLNLKKEIEDLKEDIKIKEGDHLLGIRMPSMKTFKIKGDDNTFKKKKNKKNKRNINFTIDDDNDIINIPDDNNNIHDDISLIKKSKLNTKEKFRESEFKNAQPKAMFDNNSIRSYFSKIMPEMSRPSSKITGILGFDSIFSPVQDLYTFDLKEERKKRKGNDDSDSDNNNNNNNKKKKKSHVIIEELDDNNMPKDKDNNDDDSDGGGGENNMQLALI
jgi:hypothetical protein